MLKNNFTKRLICLRGLPGSGKSTFARMIWNDYAIHEADKFFEQNGEYKFDPTKIKDAHEWCRNNVEQQMKDNELNSQYYPEIVVANTFTQEWEMKPYMELADKYGYTFISLVVENRHGNQSIHNVPAETIKKMIDRFEIKLI